MRPTPILAILLAACGPTASGGGAGTSGEGARAVAENQNAPAPEPYLSRRTTKQGGSSGAARGSGATPEDAVVVCGPVESYRYVAQHRCADRTQPLHGDPAMGRRARVGNVGENSTGHVIDHYRVPCASGDVEVFVDMYGCSGGQSLMGGP